LIGKRDASTRLPPPVEVANVRHYLSTQKRIDFPVPPAFVNVSEAIGASVLEECRNQSAFMRLDLLS
jgi:hypothetical protein